MGAVLNNFGSKIFTSHHLLRQQHLNSSPFINTMLMHTTLKQLITYFIKQMTSS